MKKIVTLFVMLILVISSSACTQKVYEIAMITVYGEIEDGSFNQATWEGIKAYAIKNDITHQYYTPESGSEKHYLSAVKKAVKNGAKIVITPGLYTGFEANYPDVKFVVLDGIDSYNSETKNERNVLTIYFKEYESGFLAGYSAVKEGFTNLGFIGGIPLPTVKKFGIGYVAGAFYASHELNIRINFKAENYAYLDSFSENDDVVKLAENWYESGVEVIHAAAGAASHSVIKAAENKNGWVIGVDIDQSSESEHVLTSAIKGIGSATYQALSAFYDGKLEEYETWHLGAHQAAVSIPFENSRFKSFNESEYNNIYKKIIDGEIIVPYSKESLSTFLFECSRYNQEIIDKV